MVTAPASEPVSVIAQKTHLRIEIDETAEDTILAQGIEAARETAEKILSRPLITQTWDYVFDAWPSGDVIKIPYPPLVSVTHVKYEDADGAESTWSSDDYIVDTASCPGRIGLAFGETWPSTTLQPIAGITVRFVCGYGDAQDVPEDYRQAILLLVGHWYEHREGTDRQTPMVGHRGEIPFGVRELLGMDRIYQL